MESACVLRKKAWCPLLTTSRTLNNQTCCYIFSELWKGGQSLFCCYHAVFQGVSQKLNDDVDQCLYVSVGHSTQHNLNRTRVRLLSSMLWLFLAFGFLALSCTPLSGSSLRSTRRSSLFSWSGKDKVARNFVCQPKSAGGFGVVDVLAKFCALHVAWIRRFCQSSSS